MQPDPTSLVSIFRALSYEPEHLEDVITQALEPLGGMQAFVRPGMTVLLKPNMLSAKAPDRAITTHPEFVAAVGRMAQQLGANVRIGDSPAGAKVGIERVWENCGFRQIAKRDGFELVNFELEGTKPVAIETGVYYIAKPVLEADLVINLPKLKTHVLTLMTGGVKNMFGSIPGFRKGMYHREAPNPRHFARIVVDIFAAVQPELTIMDAIIAMEGDGPASGNPTRLNLVLASNDAVALDTVAAHIIGLEPQRVHTIRYAADAGLGIGWIEGISVRGISILAAKPEKFCLTSNFGMELIPKFIWDMLAPHIWLRPKVDSGACSQCGLCVSSCPTNALSQNGNGGIPELTQEQCITCWCCHEICPEHAISVEKSWLARKLVR